MTDLVPALGVSPAPVGRPAGRVLIFDRSDAGPELSRALRGAGYTVEVVATLGEAIARLGAFAPDVLIARPGSGSDEGLPLLEIARERDAALPVVFIGLDSVRAAVRVMQRGASHCLAEPLTLPELLDALRSAIERRRAHARPAPTALPTHTPRPATREAPALVCVSEPMRDLAARIAAVAPTQKPLLIAGETGTGKHLVAQAIHAASGRAAAPLVTVRCGAAPAASLHDELFGRARGTRRAGRIELAEGGTLLLDEIGAAPPAVQANLVRLLQGRPFEPSSGGETRTPDVRIIATTRRDLASMVTSGAFRADLHELISAITLHVPPLRERRADAPELAAHALARISAELGLAPSSLTPDALRVLAEYDWPGNVRELEEVLERALARARGAPIDAARLSEAMRGGASGAPPIPGASFAEIERYAILATYEACGRNAQRAAEVLGISPRTVFYRLREYRGQPGRRRPRGPAPRPARQGG